MKKTQIPNRSTKTFSKLNTYMEDCFLYPSKICQKAKLIGTKILSLQ